MLFPHYSFGQWTFRWESSLVYFWIDLLSFLLFPWCSTQDHWIWFWSSCLQMSCPALCDPTDHSPPDSSVHGILQERILEWFAIPSSRGSSQSRDQTYISYVSCIDRWVLYHQSHLLVVQLISCVRLFGTSWTAAYQASLSFTISWPCSNLCPVSQWCHLTISSSVAPFSSCLQSFPASGSFPMSQFFASGGQSVVASASASVLPMNIQDWVPLGLTDLISLQTKGPRDFKSLLQHHSSKASVFDAQPSLWSNSHTHTPSGVVWPQKVENWGQLLFH